MEKKQKYSIGKVFWFVRYSLKKWALQGKQNLNLESHFDKIEMVPLTCSSFVDFGSRASVTFTGVDGLQWHTELPGANPDSVQIVEVVEDGDDRQLFDLHDVLEGLIDCAVNPDQYGLSQIGVQRIFDQYAEFLEHAKSNHDLCIYRATATTVVIQRLDPALQNER